MRVLIACGGTAGHIYPGVALAEEIIAADNTDRIIMVISRHPRDKELLKRAGSLILSNIHIETIVSVGMPQKKLSLHYIFFIWKLMAALLNSLIIIVRYRPQIAVGFGGYSSFAPVFAARLMRMPVVIHEQNVLPGKTNRLLAVLADKIAVSFPVVNNFFPSRKMINTGFPLRRRIVELSGGKKDSSGDVQDEQKLKVLVVGGSQGASGINKLVLDCLSRMDKNELDRLHFVHLSGGRDFQRVKEGYAKLAAGFQVFDFLEEMAEAYSAADVLICRAGAGTIFEAALFGLACILIPYPYGNQHQRENAAYLAERGCALIIEETSASAAELKKMLLYLSVERRSRQELSRKIQMLKLPQAGFRLKKEVDILLNNRGRYVQR